MSTLVVDELKAVNLVQEFTLIPDMLTGLRIKAVRPLLYLHNDPTGTFTISLKEGVNTIDSKSVTGAELIANSGFTASQYHWGIFTFEFNKYNVLKKNITYTIELSSSGYTFDESSFLGWVKPHEDFINTASDTIPIFTEYPYGYELWGLRI